MPKLYSSTVINELIERYEQKGGILEVKQEGSLLAFGLAILSGDGLKYCVIKERYLNDHSSAYAVRFSRKKPKL